MATVERADDTAGSGDGSAMAGDNDARLADADLVREAGALLFGYPVADTMSEALGINRRTIQRWLNAQNTVPAHLWDQLLEEARGGALRRALARLEQDLAARVTATKPED